MSGNPAAPRPRLRSTHACPTRRFAAWILAFSCCFAATLGLPSAALAVSPHLGGDGSDTCSACHVPHQAAVSAGLLGKLGEVDGQASVCLTCHDGTGASSNIESGPDSFGLTSGHVLEGLDAGEPSTDLTNSCSGCHTPHGDYAARPRLALASVNSTPVVGGGNEWCFACHNDEQDWYAQKGPYPSCAAPLRDASGYPTAGVFGGQSVYADAVSNAHAGIPASTEPTRVAGDCLYCHRAHGSSSQYDSLIATLAPSTPGRVAQDRSTGDYAALCFMCHGGGSWEAAGAVNIKQYATRQPSDVGRNASGGHRIKSAGGDLPVNAPLPCYECHNPHGSGRGNNKMLSDALGENLDTTAGAEAVRQFCLSCHVTSDLLGWDSVGEAYASVPATAAVAGLLRNGGSSGSGPGGGKNWLRLKAVSGHKSTDASASCYDCHGDDYGSSDSSNVHSPNVYAEGQHTAGGPCMTSGCHSTDAYTIHEAGPECSACHAEDKTPSLACRTCHVGDQHPSANHVNGSPCGGCHAEDNLMSVHGDDCAKCHPIPAEGLTYAGGCSQTGCHATLHPDPWSNATYQPGHSEIEWGHPDWGSDCWNCHELNSDMGTSCTTPYCHPHMYERVAPTTTSNAAASYVGFAVVNLTATDGGQYWSGSDAQWFIAGVRETYFQVDGGVLQTGTSVVVPPPTSGTAHHTLEFWSTDNNYNTETHHIVTFTVAATDGSDDTPPEGTMAVNGGAAYTMVVAATVDSAVTDAGSGVSLMRIDPGTGAYGSWMAYAASRAITLPSADGTKTVRVEYMDGEGNTLPLTDTIVLDATAPSGTMLINNGAATTAVTGVTLNSTVSDAHSGVAQMRFSNNGSSWSAWETYASTKSWTLTSGNGSKTVYAQYLDGAGNQSATHSDTITLFDGIDSTPPTGAVTINGAALYTTTTAVTLNLSASDTGGSGLSQMCFSNNGSSWSAWETYASTKSWTLTSGNGGKTVYAMFRDGGLNESSACSDTILLDATAPTGSITINGGAASTNSPLVTLTLSASDTGGSGLSQMRFSNDNTTWGSWQAYGTPRSWMLSSGNGTKTVYAQYCDAAGNVSTLYSDTISMTSTSSTLAFVWHPPGWAEAHLRVTDATNNVITDTWVDGTGTELDLYVVVPAGGLYYMECVYYYDEWWGDEGTIPYGTWTNDTSINPDGILSPGETVIWNY